LRSLESLITNDVCYVLGKVNKVVLFTQSIMFSLRLKNVHEVDLSLVDFNRSQTLSGNLGLKK